MVQDFGACHDTNVWAKKGSRPTAVRQTEYEYLWVLGVVCPETGHAEGLLSPQLNTTIIHSFLELFAKNVFEKLFLPVVVQFGWLEVA